MAIVNSLNNVKRKVGMAINNARKEGKWSVGSVKLYMSSLQAPL